MADSYRLGAVINLNVALYDGGTGVADITFDPAPGSTDHALYYGPLSAVSTYGYTGTEGPLGASGSSSVSLPGGSLFWVVVGYNGLDGCNGVDSACMERPGFGAPQDPNRSCSVPWCP
ncbi:MAG: hypothetical protein GTO30_07855 [Acidobacteria bacterium]|nr:hypothetical protein [Acidobacteriota bacterium]NIM61557.1 hypothetical protein [Acidobacteriota bacterium]NIQ84654.1 hypothetical protein [Acidobacteriota bacterium]NIT10554.1 hypothetical protein [Acidobacteriota bacterium]